MDTSDTANKLFQKVTGVSKGAVRALMVGLTIVLLMLVVAIVVTLLADSGLGWDFSSLPNARKVVGDENKWPAVGTAAAGVLILGAGLVFLGKLSGGGKLSPDDLNVAAPLLKNE